MTVATAHEQPDGSTSSWWKPWRWRFGTWWFWIVAFLLLVPIIVRTWFLSAAPVIPEPFDVAAFSKADVSLAENAFTDYALAAQMRANILKGLSDQFGQESKALEVFEAKGWAGADESVRGWVDGHQEVMATWKRGTTKDKALGVSPSEMNFTTTLNVVQEARSFVRYAMIEAARCRHEGRLDEAWSWLRAANRCGAHLSQRGCIIQGLVAVAVHTIAANNMGLWAEDPAVTEEMLRQALRETQHDHAAYAPESDLLKCEYLVMKNSMNLTNFVELLDPVIKPAPGPGAAAGGFDLPAPLKQAGLWVIGEPQLAVRVSRHVLANQLREIDKPLSSRAKLAGKGFVMLFADDPSAPRQKGQLSVSQIELACQRSLVFRYLASSTKLVDDAIQRMHGKQKTLEVMLAAQAHRRQKGEFPEKLDQLVPQYLEAIPLDPCDPAGGLLRYRRDSPTSAVVWSVGDGGADHEGDVEQAPNKRTSDIGFRLGPPKPEETVPK